MPLFQAPIGVAGRDPLARRVLDSLRRSGRRARRLDLVPGERLAGLRLAVLILADPEDPLALLRGLAGTLPPRRRPLRVILVLAARPALHPPEDLVWPKGPLAIESFALEERVARVLLARWPLHLGFDPRFDQGPHLLIAGFGPLARAFLAHALRLIQYGGPRPRVSILCPDPQGSARWLGEQYPQAPQVAEIHWLGADPAALRGLTPPSLALVEMDPPAQEGLALARRISAETAGCAPVLLEVGDAEPAGELCDWDGRIVPIAFAAEACRADVLLDGAGDALARTIHEHYTDTIAAQGRDPASEPAGQPWETLAESYREANRHQADHIAAKLALTDCRAVPEEQVQSFAFAPVEVERLAEIEHDRWAADRYMDGWSYAPVRDNARKHHPQLIPYDALSGPMKDLDRFAVRGLSALLARSGLGVVRMLIVAIPEPGPDCLGGRRLVSLADRVVRRLVARYPDRSLILASSLADPRGRLVVRRAMALGGAGLFMLCPRPLAELIRDLNDAGDERGRIDLLGLVARAERRIPLEGEAGLAAWLARRADIQLVLGESPAPAGVGRWVRLAAPGHRPDWSFEY